MKEETSWLMDTTYNNVGLFVRSIADCYLYYSQIEPPCGVAPSSSTYNSAAPDS